jgi:uncharacterized protein involved in response to NO
MNQPQQAKFHLGFIRAALGIALFAGFAIGAHLAAVIGLERPLGPGFYSFIQLHGHLQLVGWAGLFIIGISLHFIPRLAGVPIAFPQWIGRIQFLLTAGLVSRALFHSVLPYIAASAIFQIFSFFIVLSGLLELAGITSYIFLVTHSMRRIRPAVKKRPALQAVKPYFAMMLAGWMIYAVLNLVLLGAMAVNGAATVDQAWNDFAINLFCGLVLLPVGFAFSTRMFPLYLRLPATDWSVGNVGLGYWIFFLLQLMPTLPPLLGLMPEAAFFISAVGQCGKAVVIFLFVWKLDVLLRRRAPWTVERFGEPGPERKPTRDGLPDYGEFGRFERLLYSAYVWLLIGAGLDLLTGAATIFKWELQISTDAIRHGYLLGFITLLILGMAPRMIPGFINKKLASTKLVTHTFWYGNLAAVCRVLPLLVPDFLFEKISPAVFLSQGMFALSGMFGLAAVWCLAMNLRRTAK